MPSERGGLTTATVRHMFVEGAWGWSRNGCDDKDNGADFDRWLAEHDRKAVERAEAAEHALARVRALHHKVNVDAIGPGGTPVRIDLCDHCRKRFPRPTIEAADS